MNCLSFLHKVFCCRHFNQFIMYGIIYATEVIEGALTLIMDQTMCSFAQEIVANKIFIKFWSLKQHSVLEIINNFFFKFCGFPKVHGKFFKFFVVVIIVVQFLHTKLNPLLPQLTSSFAGIDFSPRQGSPSFSGTSSCRPG